MDTITTTESSRLHQVEALSPEQIQATLEGILAATTEREASKQQLGYEEIAKLFLDAHNDRVGALNTEKEQLNAEKEQAMGQVLDTLLEDPTTSFLAQFQQLRLLYPERTVYAQLANGAQIATFCTQNHETHQPDYTFKMRVGTDGIPAYSVTKMVETAQGTRRQLEFRLRYGELKISSPGYDSRGMSYTEYYDGDAADEQLATLFNDTTKASALQLDRIDNKPDEREEYDAWAKAHMQAEYRGIAQSDGFQDGTIVLE